jgi:hypothetical protein
MIFWNVLFAPSLFAVSARAIYSQGAGRAARGTFKNEQALRRTFAFAHPISFDYDR